MEIAILDDLAVDRKQLYTIISDYLITRNIEANIRVFESGDALLDSFLKVQFDLVFLDIRMPGISGMEVAHQLRKLSAHIPLIFSTADKSYALEGYEVHAVDYLLKPFDRSRIFKVMDHVLNKQQISQYIYIKEDHMNRQILADDILFTEMHGHYVEIHTIDGTYRTYMSFKDFFECLPKQLRFQNCYRGIIVNLDRVTKLNSYGFLFENGEQVPISRTKRTEMRNAYAAYAFEKTRKGMIL